MGIGSLRRLESQKSRLFWKRVDQLKKQLMNAEQADLYRRIQNFSVDKPGSGFPFSQRLVRENGWTDEYTQRVIDEYKKFAFLAVAAGHSVAPSDQVDQVWHLHLVYTHSYWDEFCRTVLQQPLHHAPTQGGQDEQTKFHDLYNKTLASYEAFFGYPPPEDIWPSADVRFARDIHFVRVNTRRSWILPKPRLDWRIGSVLIIALVLNLTACTPLAATNVWNPFNFRGPDFLRFYLMVIGIGVGLAYYLRLRLQQSTDISPDGFPQVDVYETAYLAAGNYRAINTAIVNLVQRGHLRLLPETRSLALVDDLPENSHPLEQAVVQAIESDGGIGQVRLSALSSTKPINQCLQNHGVLLNEKQAEDSRLYPGFIIVAVLVLGFAKVWLGIVRHKPVGYLIILCFFVGWLGYLFLIKQSLYRSRLGIRLLKTLRSDYLALSKSTLEETPIPSSRLAMAFALFGASVLTGTFDDLGNVLAPLRTSAGSYAGGGCGVSGCSGGGGGGGMGVAVVAAVAAAKTTYTN